MNELVSTATQQGVAVVQIDNPPVNALTAGLPEALLNAVRLADQDAAVRAIVVICAGRTFIAGADIKEFGKITSGERKDKFSLTELMLAMEDSSKPVICAIHGTAFGGGLEVAMGAHYRVAVPSAQVGQPEVKLGLIPGAAGTQRLPRLAGVAVALEMCAFGEPVKAAAALDAGIVDRIVEGDLLEGAIAFAREVLAKGEKPSKPRDRNEKLAPTPSTAGLFAAAREPKKFSAIEANNHRFEGNQKELFRLLAEGLRWLN